MKRHRIISVFLTATICLSMVMTPITVMADDTEATSETQKTETIEKKKDKEAEKPASPKSTEKQETVETKKEKPAETEKTAPSQTEKQKPVETEEQKPTETKKQEPEQTEEQKPSETEEQKPTETEKQDSEQTEAQKPAETEPAENENKEPEDEKQDPEVIQKTGPDVEDKKERKNAIPTDGRCGDNLYFNIENGVMLVISGYGDMYDYDDDGYNVAPWTNYFNLIFDGEYNGIRTVVFDGNITSIGNHAFSSCYNLTSVSFPDSLKAIGNYAFWGCPIKNLSIPNSVTTIGENSFAECENLTSVDIPSSVTTIGDSAFYWCYNLKSVTLSNGVISIGDYAFSGCSIETVIIPKSVKHIGEGAWSGIEDNDWDYQGYNRQVKTVYYEGTEEDWKKISIDSENDLNYVPIHLADGSLIKGKNPLDINGKTATVKYKKLRKKAQKVSRSKVISIFDSQGKVTYKLASVSKKKFKKYFKVNASNGVVTIKKKLKKGTYTIKVKVTAAGNENYKPVTQTVSFKIKVK